MGNAIDGPNKAAWTGEWPISIVQLVNNVILNPPRIVQQVVKSASITWGAIQRDLDPVSEYFLVTGAS